MKYIYSLMLVFLLFGFDTSIAQTSFSVQSFSNATPSDYVESDKKFADVRVSPGKDVGNFDYDATITHYVDCSKQVLTKTVCTVRINDHGLQDI